MIFFFSSRRRHTSWPRDWSSDVCSSDLHGHHVRRRALAQGGDVGADRSQVDCGAGRVVGHEEIVPGSTRISRTAAGTAFDTASAVTGPPPLALAAALAWTSEAVAASSAITSLSAAIALALEASSAPSIPDNTSPAPAVASQDGADTWVISVPPGRATTVVLPLSKTVAPVSSAARNAHRPGSASTV